MNSNLKEKPTTKNPKSPTCGNQTEGLLNGLGLIDHGGKQIWVCFHPCNKVVKVEQP